MPVNYREYHPAYAEALSTALRLQKEEGRTDEEKVALHDLIKIIHTTHIRITSKLDDTKLSTDLAREVMNELQDSAMGCCGQELAPIETKSRTAFMALFAASQVPSDSLPGHSSLP